MAKQNLGGNSKKDKPNFGGKSVQNVVKQSPGLKSQNAKSKGGGKKGC